MISAPIAHRMPCKLRDRLLCASAVHGVDEGNIARKATRKYLKHHDIHNEEIILYDKGDDNTFRISFRLDEYTINDIKRVGHKMSHLLNTMIDWYLTLEEEATKQRKQVKPFNPPKVEYTLEESE